MLSLNKVTKHDFLSPEFIIRMLEANVPMKDYTYELLLIDGTWYIRSIDEIGLLPKDKKNVEKCLPTYTLSQLLFKLGEWHPDFKGLSFCKDAPFYSWYYKEAGDLSHYSCTAETPIESAAELLINCVKEGFGCVNDIGSKYEW